MPDLVSVDDIVIQQGDDRPLTWTLAGSSTGAPVDLAGYSVVAQVRAKPTASTVLHEWSTDAGNAVLSESTVVLKVDDSETWTWSRGVYDIHLTDSSGQTEVVARGAVSLVPAVTR